MWPDTSFSGCAVTKSPATLTISHLQPCRRPFALTLPVPHPGIGQLARDHPTMAHGYKGSKRLKRGRWHGIGAESQMLGLGTTVSAGLTVGPHTSIQEASAPGGPPGPWSQLCQMSPVGGPPLLPHLCWHHPNTELGVALPDLPAEEGSTPEGTGPALQSDRPLTQGPCEPVFLSTPKACTSGT